MSPMNKFFMWCAIIGVLAIMGPVVAAHFATDIADWFRTFFSSFGDSNIKN